MRAGAAHAGTEGAAAIPVKRGFERTGQGGLELRQPDLREQVWDLRAAEISAVLAQSVGFVPATSGRRVPHAFQGPGPFTICWWRYRKRAGSEDFEIGSLPGRL